MIEWWSIREVEVALGQRFSTNDATEQIVMVRPGFNGKLVVSIAGRRLGPEAAPAEASGEREVTADVPATT